MVKTPPTEAGVYNISGSMQAKLGTEFVTWPTTVDRLIPLENGGGVFLQSYTVYVA